MFSLFNLGKCCFNNFKNFWGSFT